MKRLCAIGLLFFCFLNGAGAQEDSIKVTTTLHEDGTRTEMKSDAQARSAEATTLSGDTVLRRIVYKLDADGQMLEGDVFGADGKMIFHAVFKRGALNRVVEEFNYTPDGKLLRRMVYGYNPDGRIAKIDTFDAAGNPVNESRGIADKRKSLPRRR